MKPKKSLIYILAVLTALPFVGSVAPAATIDVLQTFDYPGFAGQVTATLPQKISDQADLAGIVIFSTGVEKAFIYKTRNGRFSDPFAEPNDTGNMTHGRGINNRRHVVGKYLNGTDGTFHGYKLLHPAFVEFNVSDSLDTTLLGINNAGDFVGSFILSDGTQPAFVSLSQRVTAFAVPDATATFAYQLNTANEIIGYYIDANGVTHGYTRDGAGNLTFPIDVASASGTLLLGNNDSNWGVGRYTDASGATHGLYFITPDDIQSYDYPGATFTSLNGINKNGLICGYYVDATGIAHGILAKLDLTAAGNRDTSIPVAPVKPVQPWADILRIGEPAL